MMKVILEKPWGTIRAYALNQPCTVKLITINPGQETSLHYHKLRDDVWIILDGGLEVTIGEETFRPVEGEEFMIPAEKRHKIKALRGRGRVLEIDIGFTSEDDTYRITDAYGRELEEREEPGL